MKAYRLRWNELEQVFINGDLEHEETRSAYYALFPQSVLAVYSDPPWNPGNASYWRNHAGLEPCESYARFSDGWVWVAAQCQRREAEVVMVEQAVNPAHQQYLLDAIARNPDWKLPYRTQWKVLYGSSNKRIPNALMYWSDRLPRVDPSGLYSESVTIRAFADFQARGYLEPEWVCDPCMGKGMTSRMAHAFGLCCIGSELNPKRLEITRNWLKREGYTEEEINL
jgi:hypothetical protein